MKKLRTIALFFMSILISQLLSAQVFQPSNEERVGKKEDGSVTLPAHYIGKQTTTNGGYIVARTRYFFNLKSLPVNADIVSVTLKANTYKTESIYYTITKTDTLAKTTANLYDHITASPKLCEYIPYSASEYSISLTDLTNLVISYRGKTLTLGAYSQSETDTKSGSTLNLSLEVTLRTNVTITATNNFQTTASLQGKIIIDGGAQIDAPASVTKQTGQNVAFTAVTPQTDMEGYQRVWAASVPLNKSEWIKYDQNHEKLPISNNSEQSYSINGITQTENNKTYEANLRKQCNVNCQINSSGGGTVTMSANGMNVTVYPGSPQQIGVIEGNTVNLTANDQTASGIDYQFDHWTYTTNGVQQPPSYERTFPYNPSFHSDVTAYFKGYPNISMMNPQGNENQIGAQPTITWTDNPNQNVTYRLTYIKESKSPNSTSTGESDIIQQGVQTFTFGPRITANTPYSGYINFKLYANYAIDNTSRLVATKNFSIEGDQICDCGPGGTEKKNAGIQKDVVITKYAVANYPNPFNPTTVINYQVPEAGHITLKVYDIMGREIATLIDGVKTKGSYNVNFSMDQYHLASGIYFCRMQAGKNVVTSKMILSK